MSIPSMLRVAPVAIFALAAAALLLAAIPSPVLAAAVPAAADTDLTDAADLVKAITAAQAPDLDDDFSDPGTGWTISDTATRHMGYVHDGYHITADGTAEPWS
jgi:hypothetical protein